MEANVAGNRHSLLHALRAAMPALQDKFGDPAGFRDLAAPILLRESDGGVTRLEEADLLADQLHRAVTRLRALHFRRLRTQQALDAAMKALEPSLNSHSTNPVLSAGLWLAHRMQSAAISFLDSDSGRESLARAEAQLGAPPFPWLRALLGENKLPTLDRIEQELVERLAPVFGGSLNRVELYALAGQLLESARAAARQPPVLSLPDAPPRELTAGERLSDALAAPVRQAELEQAHARFAKLTPDATAKRFEVFKVQLLRAIKDVATYAPLGADAFCQALEAVLYPYPAQLEWIRSFVKPIWINASQSSLFEGRNTPDLIQQRYEHLRKTRQGNPVIGEMAKAFALDLCRTGAKREQPSSFLEELDLVAEFGWPASLEDLKRQWETSAPAA